MDKYDWLIDVIKSIEDERRKGNYYPICASFYQVMGRCPPDKRKLVRDGLNALYVRKKIRVWNAINDKMIQWIY